MGGIGSRAQSFAEERRYFQVHVDSSGNGIYTEVPNPPYLRIIGGSVGRLSAIAPSRVVVGKPFSLVVRALDRFGNASHAYDGLVHMTSTEEIKSLPEEYLFIGDDQGVHRFDGLTASEPGIYRITVTDESNMVQCVRRGRL